MTVGKHTAPLAILLGAVAGLGVLVLVAPGYLTLQGFPLDDAWIHAVYGRSLARSGMLAYNPGVPATGSTSPLWAVLLAVPQLLAARVRAVVLLTKLLGFGLHAAAALVVFAALGGEAAPADEGRDIMRVAAALLVAFHPDLVSASVSGMEVSLAALAACTLLYAARRWPAWSYAIVCTLAPLARPELGLLCYALPFLLYVGADRRRLGALTGAAIVGNVLCFGGMALRNVAVSGLPLPATFYAKVGTGELSIPVAEVVGFRDLLGRIAITDSSVLLVLLGAFAVWLLFSPRRDAERTAAAALLAGLAFCAVSFVLVRPFDPAALYHQRYVLPAIPLIVAAVPVLAAGLLRRGLPAAGARAGCIAVLALLAAGVLVEAPFRYAWLANDAHNIDDVQVAAGESLAAASPTAVVWAVDAGALRYFGNAFVVDLMGLNNAAMLGPRAQRFLDAHPPRYLEIVPTWSSLDRRSRRQLEGPLFQPSTLYTVTGVPAMRRHWLLRCPPTFAGGELRFRGRRFRFSCAPQHMLARQTR
jgi:hypothetical protein